MIFDKGSMKSSLDFFLHCTTPVVKSQFLPKSEIRNLNRLWHPYEREIVDYFTLSDLWNCYDEWSAYRARVPIVLNNGETLVQYYVPYLSAIQIYTSTLSINILRFEHREENRKDCLRTLLSLIEEAGKANKMVDDARYAYCKERLRANHAFMERLRNKTANALPA